MSARWRRWVGFAVLAVASLATSPPYVPLSFGAVFDVTADPVQGDTLYASLTTRRIHKCAETEGPQLLGADCMPEEVAHSVETYRSQDGGRTWSLYTEVGGYLWADPPTPDRLYVLNEGGWHRVEGSQVHSFDVPLAGIEVRFFSQDYRTIEVLPNAHPIAFDPVTPDELYMADDVRILVSTDGGETWTSRPAAPLSTRIMALSVAPSAPQTLYVADSNNVSRSDDGGRSWVHRTPVGEKACIRRRPRSSILPGVGYGFRLTVGVPGETSIPGAARLCPKALDTRAKTPLYASTAQIGGRPTVRW